ncbi:unnamed protein product [Rotaria sordida]|nr:unnamed protein product [Rotaria sordida]
MRDNQLRTPLHHAIMRNHIAIIDKLIKAGAKIDIPDVQGATPVHYAYRFGKDQEMPNIDSYLLHSVCRQTHGHELISNEKISHQLITKSTMTEINTDGFTALMVAVKYGQVECVKKLLNHQYCDKDVLEMRSVDSDRTVLHICAEVKSNQITDLLLPKAKQFALDLMPVDVMGNTPLHICVQKDNQHMIDPLLSDSSISLTVSSITQDKSNRRTENLGGIPKMLKIKNNNGLTAFHEAIENGHYEIVHKILMKVNYSVQLIEERDQQLRTGLHIAALKAVGFVKAGILFITNNSLDLISFEFHLAIMSTGEIDYSGFMHSDNTTAYYKLGYIMLVLFAIAMTILVSNLLISLAVGEIGPLMSTAKNHRLDMLIRYLCIALQHEKRFENNINGSNHLSPINENDLPILSQLTNFNLLIGASCDIWSISSILHLQTSSWPFTNQYLDGYVWQQILENNLSYLPKFEFHMTITKRIPKLDLDFVINSWIYGSRLQDELIILRTKNYIKGKFTAKINISCIHCRTFETRTTEKTIDDHYSFYSDITQLILYIQNKKSNVTWSFPLFQNVTNLLVEMPIIKSSWWKNLFNIVNFRQTTNDNNAQENLTYLSKFVYLTNITPLEFPSAFHVN